jgi:hypothetical protein
MKCVSDLASLPSLTLSQLSLVGSQTVLICRDRANLIAKMSVSGKT